MSAVAPRTPTPPTVETPAEKVRRLIAEQGVTETATVERLFGSGRELFADEAEFEQFLATVNHTRTEKE